MTKNFEPGLQEFRAADLTLLLPRSERVMQESLETQPEFPALAFESSESTPAAITSGTRLRVQGRFEGVLNSAARELMPLVPTAIVRGLDTGNIHPDILHIVEDIEFAVRNALESDVMRNMALSGEQVRAGVVRLGETAGSIFDISSINPEVINNMEHVRSQLIVLGHIVAERMLVLPEVRAVINQSDARYRTQQRMFVDTIDSIVEESDRFERDHEPVVGDYMTMPRRVTAHSPVAQKPATQRRRSTPPASLDAPVFRQKPASIPPLPFPAMPPLPLPQAPQYA